MLLNIKDHLFDIKQAEVVEIIIDRTNKVWVNVNGRCVLRIGQVVHVEIDAPSICRGFTYEPSAERN